MSDRPAGLIPPLRADVQPRPVRGLALLLTLAGRLRIGVLEVRLPDGSVRTLRGAEPGPRGVLRICHDRLGRRLLLGGSGVSLGEAYMDGDWDTPDLPRLLEVLQRNALRLDDWFAARPWWRGWLRLGHALRRNSRSGSRRNIEAHYDLGNDFYARWLDPTMSYSAAVFADATGDAGNGDAGNGDAGNGDLEVAQRRKWRLLADRLGVAPGGHVLEIGCGWGGLATYLAAERGLRVTALTLSPAQHEFACHAVARAGLAERVSVELRDYRSTTGTYDGIVSVEMIEAVGEAYWPDYFDVLHRSLTPGGRAVLQAITIQDERFARYRRSPDFIQRHVFPGGMLPSPGLLRGHAAAAGLRWTEDAWYGADYARTLMLWRRRFVSAWPAIAAQGFAPRFRRMWEFYLAYCEAGFRTGTIDLAQVVLTRPGRV